MFLIWWRLINSRNRLAIYDDIVFYDCMYFILSLNYLLIFQKENLTIPLYSYIFRCMQCHALRFLKNTYKSRFRSCFMLCNFYGEGVDCCTDWNTGTSHCALLLSYFSFIRNFNQWHIFMNKTNTHAFARAHTHTHTHSQP